ncbi:DNA primase [Sphingomonas soli]|uniref:DNA primase n=1 Tax=Sphingomonas soli TaxID=266127 RepID=UPI00083204D5|nr:DNA primase [Sphingomonas soli]
MSLTPAFLDELRARTLLSGLIARTVKLQRAGREFRACCPFHNEKTPSFYVNDDKGFYHCFGCSAHGDAIRWMTDQRGLPFIDAVKELAQAAGMEMPEQDRRSAEKAQRAKGLHEAMEDAARWFSERLHGIEGAEARALLKKRGVSDEVARAFGMGFAPDSRGKLKEALKGYGDPMLVEAGLLIGVENKEPYDRFRGRLMIPIRDVRGRTIAFGGRIIGDGEPKYLNSPETPLFDKGRTLYNLDRAQAAARKTGRIIAVEGYMDVIALAQAGFHEVVAPLGTAMTEHQLERLWRASDTAILCFDGDSAGQRAAIRASVKALASIEPGRRLSIVGLPEGLDPDELIYDRGPHEFDNLLRSAQPLADFLWSQEVGAEPLDTPEARAGLRKRLRELVQSIVHRDTREEYSAEFRRRLDALFALPSREVRRPRSGKFHPNWSNAEAPPSTVARRLKASGLNPVLMRELCGALILYPTAISSNIERLTELIDHSREGQILEALLDGALSYPRLDKPTVETILATAGLKAAAEKLVRADGMAYAYIRRHRDHQGAGNDIREAISALAAQPALNRAIEEATAILKERPSDDAFARQVALVRQRQELETHLGNLKVADDENLDE